MGQYHVPVSIDAMERLMPHRLGTGLKLLEWGCSGFGVATAMGLFLVGEGRWSGHRLVVVGDYAEDADLPSVPNVSALYSSRQEAQEYRPRQPERYPLPDEAYPLDVSDQAAVMFADLGIWRSTEVESGWWDPPTNTDWTGPDVEAVIVNQDKGQVISPSTYGRSMSLGDWIRNMPQGDDWIGPLGALVGLLSISNGRGGGDMAPDPLVGAWAGDHIAIVPVGPDLDDMEVLRRLDLDG